MSRIVLPQPRYIEIPRGHEDFVLGRNEVCPTCGLRGGQCITLPCKYNDMHERGYVFGKATEANW
jgi:hypothetical protein